MNFMAKKFLLKNLRKFIRVIPEDTCTDKDLYLEAEKCGMIMPNE